MHHITVKLLLSLLCFISVCFTLEDTTGRCGARDVGFPGAPPGQQRPTESPVGPPGLPIGSPGLPRPPAPPPAPPGSPGGPPAPPGSPGAPPAPPGSSSTPHSPPGPLGP